MCVIIHCPPEPTTQNRLQIRPDRHGGRHHRCAARLGAGPVSEAPPFGAMRCVGVCWWPFRFGAICLRIVGGCPLQCALVFRVHVRGGGVAESVLVHCRRHSSGKPFIDVNSDRGERKATFEFRKLVCGGGRVTVLL